MWRGVYTASFLVGVGFGTFVSKGAITRWWVRQFPNQTLYHDVARAMMGAWCDTPSGGDLVTDARIVRILRSWWTTHLAACQVCSDYSRGTVAGERRCARGQQLYDLYQQLEAVRMNVGKL